MRPSVVAGCLALAFALVACDGDTGPTPAQERAESLEDVPLREDEAPDGLTPDEEASGPLGSFRELLPPQRAVPSLPQAPREITRGFEAGFQAVYRADDPGGEGVSSASSSAVRFSGADVAGRFVGFLRGVQEATVRTEGREHLPEAGAIVEAPGLGEEGYGWHRAVPGGETAGYIWRRGDLVVTVSLGGTIGSASTGAALQLARTIDGRL